MFTRIALMFVVAATLCGAAFTLGSASSKRQQDVGDIPAEHPVALALHYQHELALTDDQIQKLKALHDQMAAEFGPLRQQADALQQRMQSLKSSAQDQEAAKEIKQEGDALSAKMQPMFERYAKQVGDLLTDDQRQMLMKFANAAAHPSGGDDFQLNFIMQSRDQLEITPQQFTKLQYLLADFIRGFAPLREKMELLQLEMKDKFASQGENPTPEYTDKAQEIQKEVKELQSQTSEKAKTDVLDAKQRTKLEELLHGEPHPAPAGG